MSPNFSSISAGREDRILKLAIEARQDKDGVNLVAGVPLLPDGSTMVFECMRNAQAALKIDNGYGPIAGLPDLIRLTEIDIFGESSARLKAGQICSVVTPGGTGALFTAGRILLKGSYKNAPIYCPALTWDNHAAIFSNLGYSFIQNLDYQRNSVGQLDFDQFQNALSRIPESAILLIQGPGNNPAGFDFSEQQTLEIARICQSKNTMLIYDFAYQQLGQGFEQDSTAVRNLTDQLGLNFIVCYSYSKRYGTFGQRAGMISAVCESKDQAQVLRSVLMESNRSCFSNPPRFSQELVLWVKQNKEAEHYAEVEELRARSVSERNLFIDGMLARGFDFSYMKNDAGMFIFLNGLSADKCTILKEQHHVHGVPWRGMNDIHQGLRLNALGLGQHNRDRLMDALAQTL